MVEENFKIIEKEEDGFETMKPFNFDDFSEINNMYLTGEKLINVSAVGILLKCIEKVL
jgi:hypothetical protein